MFGTHRIRPSVGIMHAQPGCSNHNLRVPETQCADGTIHLCLNVMVGSGLLDHGRVHDSAEPNSSFSTSIGDLHPGFVISHVRSREAIKDNIVLMLDWMAENGQWM
jgi:hypothetical protein